MLLIDTFDMISTYFEKFILNFNDESEDFQYMCNIWSAPGDLM